MPFKAYKKLAEILFESKNPEHVFAHSFLVFDWNLVSRAEYVVGSTIDLVAFDGDQLLFDVGLTKTDQDGVRHIDHPFNVSSCPEHPQVCAHLAMARLIMANPAILLGNCALFEGVAQYDRFNKIFHSIVTSVEWRDEFARLGMPLDMFGTHSIRKGAATHMATGSTACPPIASICLRANWAMPGVLNRYLKYENAGDQFVGKSVSGRSRKKKEFAASCPYFDFAHVSSLDKSRMEHRLHSWLREMMPDGSQDNRKVFSLYKICVASIVYHDSYLQEKVHPDSMLRTFELWTNSEDIPFKEFVIIRYPWDATAETPEITGLPPDTMLLAELESLKQTMETKLEALETKMDALKDEVASRVKSDLVEELDKRDIGGSDFARNNDLVQQFEGLLIKFSEMLAETKTTADAAGGVVALANTEPEFESGGFISDEEVDIELELEDQEKLRLLEMQRSKQLVKKRTQKVGFHHGHFNPLPVHWRIPKGMTVIQLMNLWLVGSAKDSVPPLRKLSGIHLKHLDPRGRVRSKMRTLMTLVEKVARRENVWLKEKRWEGRHVTKMWSTIWPHLRPYLVTRTKTKDGGETEKKSRVGQIAWRTCYNKLQAMGGTRRPRKVVHDIDIDVA